MPLIYDDAMTAFRLGVAFLNLYSLRSGSSLLTLIILWFAVFPVFESAIRAALRPAFLLQPQRLWGLSIVAALPYLLAVIVLALRWRQRSRPRLGA